MLHEPAHYTCYMILNNKCVSVLVYNCQFLSNLSKWFIPAILLWVVTYTLIVCSSCMYSWLYKNKRQKYDLLLICNLVARL